MKNINHNLKYKPLLLLILILLIGISFFIFLPNEKKFETAKKIKDKTVEFYKLKSSGKEINITIPENKTYYTMEGYYPGTFGFESEEDGTSRTDIAYVDGTNAIQSNCYVDIVNNFKGHNKILRIYDGNPDGNAEARNYFTSPQEIGTIEWWWSTSTSGSNAMVCHFHEGIIGTYAGGVSMIDGNFVDIQGNIVQSYSTNKWYHNRLIFNTISDTYDWYIDGVLRVDNGSFLNPVSNIGSTNIKGGWTAIGSCYVDAIGYSWDPDYTIGDNKYEGILLSFEKSFNEDWLGYSLDGQPNKQLSGNITIPFLNYGLHSIQVFGNDSFGSTFESELRYFSIKRSSEPEIPSYNLFILVGFTGTIMVLFGAILFRRLKVK